MLILICFLLIFGTFISSSCLVDHLLVFLSIDFILCIVLEKITVREGNVVKLPRVKHN